MLFMPLLSFFQPSEITSKVAFEHIYLLVLVHPRQPKLSSVTSSFFFIPHFALVQDWSLSARRQPDMEDIAGPHLLGHAAEC